jgi:hypothetical protein
MLFRWPVEKSDLKLAQNICPELPDEVLVKPDISQPDRSAGYSPALSVFCDKEFISIKFQI